MTALLVPGSAGLSGHLKVKSGHDFVLSGGRNAGRTLWPLLSCKFHVMGLCLMAVRAQAGCCSHPNFGEVTKSWPQEFLVLLCLM